MEGLHAVTDRDDFKKFYRNVEANIIIRKFQRLDNIPEFSRLPSKIQQQIRIMNELHVFAHVALQDEGFLYTTIYTAVINKLEEENWFGLLSYNQTTGVTAIFNPLLGINPVEKHFFTEISIFTKMETIRSNGEN